MSLERILEDIEGRGFDVLQEAQSPVMLSESPAESVVMRKFNPLGASPRTVSPIEESQRVEYEMPQSEDDSESSSDVISLDSTVDDGMPRIPPSLSKTFIVGSSPLLEQQPNLVCAEEVIGVEDPFPPVSFTPPPRRPFASCQACEGCEIRMLSLHEELERRINEQAKIWRERDEMLSVEFDKLRGAFHYLRSDVGASVRQLGAAVSERVTREEMIDLIEGGDERPTKRRRQ